jgi:hypothetical protein
MVIVGRNVRMVEMMVKSMRDQSLKTVFGQYLLIEGEVKRIQFKNMDEFDSMVEMGIIMPAPKGAEESKQIPVFSSPVSEETGLPVVLNDGEQILKLSNDPDEVGESTCESIGISDETAVTDLEEDDELEDDVDDWTSEIDHV